MTKKDYSNGALDKEINEVIADIRNIGKSNKVNDKSKMSIPDSGKLVTNSLPLYARAVRVFSSKDVRCIKVKLYKGEYIVLHSHEKLKETIICLEGNIIVYIGEVSHNLLSGDSIVIPTTSNHRIELVLDSELLVSWSNFVSE